jgi:hypothetical protein
MESSRADNVWKRIVAAITLILLQALQRSTSLDRMELVLIESLLLESGAMARLRKRDIIESRRRRCWQSRQKVRQLGLEYALILSLDQSRPLNAIGKLWEESTG